MDKTMRMDVYRCLLGVVVILCLAPMVSFGQNNANKGDRYFDKNLFQDAIKYYRLETKTGNRQSANYARRKLAMCYRILGEFEMAEDMYQKLLKSKRNREDPIYYLLYGKSLKSSAKYAEAKVQFNQYIKLKPNDPLGPIFLHSCDSAQKWLEETIGKEVKNIKQINTSESDFAPVLMASNELVFSSSREGTTTAFISFDGGMNVNRLDIYKTNISSLNGQEKVECDGFEAVNSPLHEGSATFSADGKEMYFTRTIKGKKAKKGDKNEVLSTLQVYYSKVDSTGDWTEPVSAFSFNSTKYSIGQPSLSKDGERIYFISDMKGGYGGTDIYYSEKREDGSWIEPINAGGNVNTFGHELFPYIADNGKLYFSSDTHIGMGKLDIFSSSQKKGEWTNVQNLKPPYNSIGNDFGIVFDRHYHRGFFSSDRFNGMGGEDIYSFSENAPIEIIFNGEQLEFADNGIYDGLKYTLKNTTTQTDTTLLAVDGRFSYPLEVDQDYVLVAKKNRFSISNKIDIRVKRAHEENYLEVIIKPQSNPIFVGGRLTIPDVTDTANIRRLPIKEWNIKLVDSVLFEMDQTTQEGKYSFEKALQAGITYKIIASKKKEEKIIPQPVANLNDSVALTGVVEDKSGNRVKAKVMVRKKKQIVKELHTDSAGNFEIYLTTGANYEVTVIADGYYPGLKTLTLENYEGKSKVTKNFKLNLISK